MRNNALCESLNSVLRFWCTLHRVLLDLAEQKVARVENVERIHGQSDHRAIEDVYTRCQIIHHQPYLRKNVLNHF